MWKSTSEAGATARTIEQAPRDGVVNFKGVAITPATSKTSSSGEGMPRRRRGGKGHLVITFDVRFPATPVDDPAKQAALRGALA